MVENMNNKKFFVFFLGMRPSDDVASCEISLADIEKAVIQCFYTGYTEFLDDLREMVDTSNLICTEYMVQQMISCTGKKIEKIVSEIEDLLNSIDSVKIEYRALMYDYAVNVKSAELLEELCCLFTEVNNRNGALSLLKQELDFYEDDVMEEKNG